MELWLQATRHKRAFNLIYYYELHPPFLRSPEGIIPMDRKRLAIVGMPNVGKSVLFNALTGTYATVSNYPGTTVEVMWGRANISGIEFDVVDTPGAYSLLPVTEDERVTLLLLLNEDFDIVLHVVDARCIRRMLGFTLQLLEADLPLMLVVNILDEACRIGMTIDIPGLERILGIPVVGTALSRGWGLSELKCRVAHYVSDLCIPQPKSRQSRQSRQRPIRVRGARNHPSTQRELSAFCQGNSTPSVIER